MTAIKQLVGKVYRHKIYGKVKVTAVVKKSRTKVKIKVIDRGPGYDEDKKKYTGVKTNSGWYRGQNYAYSEEYEVHKNELTLKTSDQIEHPAE